MILKKCFKPLFRRIFILLLSVVCLIIASCNPSHRVLRKGYLLDENSLSIDKPGITRDEISGFIQQKPNKRLLGVFRFNVWVYEHTNQGKDTRIKRWFKNSFGKVPVILDTTLTDNSLSQIKIYLGNKGYFGAEVKRQITYKKKRAKVKYLVTLNKPYSVRNISYSINDSILDTLVKSRQSASFIKTGDIFDVYKLEDERERLTNILKNEGYYYFSREYILFKIDSTLKNHQLDINVNILNIRSSADTSLGKNFEIKHQKYLINNIYIYPEFNISKPDSIFDTVNIANRYFFIYKGHLKIKPQAITRNIFLKKNDVYRLDDVSRTYDRLGSLPLHRFVNFNFKPPLHHDTSNLLDCHIELSRTLIQQFTFGTEGTNSGGYLGIGGNFGYVNKNIFRGAETFRLRLKGALEMQKMIGGSTKNVFLFFNMLELGVETGIEFPKLLFMPNQKRFSRFSSPKTMLVSGINYQTRPYYQRYITNISLGYEWKQSETVGHLLSPLEINSVRIFPADTFTNYLNSLKDTRYIYQYTDHLIMALKYSFIFNNQPLTRSHNFCYFRFNFESSGNVLNLYNKILNGTKDAAGYYTLFNIHYAQYLRGDADFRYYNVINKWNTLVFRLSGGLGVPYGNSKSLPFEKGFYSGGANGMRGWEIRSLGPGSFRDTANANFDKMGDIVLEGNIEYRYPLYRFFKGALFVDAGNIWMLRDNKNFPGGQFNSVKFINQIALDAGLGLRMDLSYFVFRIDGSLPIKTPSLPENHRWVNFNHTTIKDVMWNFGIGYPF